MRMNTSFVCQLTEHGPLQVIVAKGARHRGMPRHVFADKIVDDGGSECFALVAHQVRDTQASAQVTGIVQILRIAILFIKAEGDTGHFISGIHQEQGSYRAVRPPTHSQQNTPIFFHEDKDKDN